MSFGKKIGKFIFGDFELPLPSPYIIYFLALLGFAVAMLLSSQVVLFAKESERLENMKNDLASHKQLLDDVKELKKEVGELEITREIKKAQLKKLEDQTEDETTKRDSIKKGNFTLQTVFEKLQLDIKKESSELEKAKNEQEAKNRELNTLTIEIENEDKNKLAAEKEKEKLEKEVVGLEEKRKELDKLERKIADLRAENEGIAKLNTITLEFNKVLDKLPADSLKSAASELDKKIATLNVENFQQQLASLVTLVSELKNTSKQAQDLVPNINNKINQIQDKEQRDLDSTIKSLQKLQLDINTRLDDLVKVGTTLGGTPLLLRQEIEKIGKQDVLKEEIKQKLIELQNTLDEMNRQKDEMPKLTDQLMVPGDSTELTTPGKQSLSKLPSTEKTTEGNLTSEGIK